MKNETNNDLLSISNDLLSISYILFRRLRRLARLRVDLLVQFFVFFGFFGFFRKKEQWQDQLRECVQTENWHQKFKRKMIDYMH